jgi:ribonuclease-3
MTWMFAPCRLLAAGAFAKRVLMDMNEILERCQAILGRRFDDLDLLRCALTHASVAETRVQSNERLEFLGDAVMGMIVCQHLYEQFPEYLEGDLTKLKSAVVSRATCAEIAKTLGLNELIVVGKGMTTQGELPTSLAAGALESVIAALWIDGGAAVTTEFVQRIMQPHIDQFAATSHQQNYKSLLQQHVQKELAATPVYELIDTTGPDHSKQFEVRVVAGGRVFPSAQGSAKKQAEQKAAQLALEAMGVLEAAVVPLAAESSEEGTDAQRHEGTKGEPEGVVHFPLVP